MNRIAQDEPSRASLAVLAALQFRRNVYAGTADPGKVSRNRARNKVARRSRRINRGRR